MSDVLDQKRRKFMGAAALGMALAPFGLSAIASARPGSGAAAAGAAGAPDASNTTGEGATSFHSLKQVKAGVLDIGYAEDGHRKGPVVILLHGWPYDIYSFVDVAPILAAAGYRVIVPYLRGYGSTRILRADTPRNGQQSVFAVDVIALMDALEIDQAVIAGFDWGGRAANIIAAIWPERCRALVSVSGYLIGSQQANRKPLAPQVELQAWFQYYFATERGATGYAEHRNEFNRLIWQDASPQFKFDDETYLRTAE